MERSVEIRGLIGMEQVFDAITAKQVARVPPMEAEQRAQRLRHVPDGAVGRDVKAELLRRGGGRAGDGK